MNTINCTEDTLREGIALLAVPLGECEQKKLMSFLGLLQKWNKAYNLTAIRDLNEMVKLHLLDSLAVVPFILDEKSILDVGTGAGFPGIPLAICFPDKQFTLLDGNGKKIRFLLQVISSLGLENVTAVHSRVEKFRSEQCFDGIISRAVGKLSNTIQQAGHLLGSSGKWLFMKGEYPQEELQDIDQEFSVHPLIIPGVEAKRHLVVITT